MCEDCLRNWLLKSVYHCSPNWAPPGYLNLCQSLLSCILFLRHTPPFLCHQTAYIMGRAQHRGIAEMLFLRDLPVRYRKFAHRSFSNQNPILNSEFRANLVLKAKIQVIQLLKMKSGMLTKPCQPLSILLWSLLPICSLCIC